MKKCIVIGGGLAGLTAAAYLANSGFSVEVIEASPKLGGRAYSFIDNQTGTIIDNGQHIMMGCYVDTLRFFKLIGAEKNLVFQKRLKVNFIKENFQVFPVKALPIPYPFNLLSALMRYNAISLRERMMFLKFFLKLPFVSIKKLDGINVYDWLVKENQNERIRKAFWEMLAVGALNTSIKKASAAVFAHILKKMFFAGNKAATIIIPKYGLSETYCSDAVKFIESKGGKVNLLEEVKSIKVDSGRVNELITSKRIIPDFDFVVSAVPHYSIKKLLGDDGLKKDLEFCYSTILSIHLWIKGDLLKDDFYGLINSSVHWIFNHKDHLTLVISDANNLNEKSKEEIFELAAGELERFAGINRSRIISYKIIKEKRATFVPTSEIINRRPKTKTDWNNFLFAGDWIDTGLPSTIESAVKSGRMASDMITKLQGLGIN